MGMINYKAHRKRIERLYIDKCTIYRYQKVSEGGETILKPAPIYTDQPCLISQKTLGANNQTDAQNNIQYETKLFIAPELEIKQGDMIEATRGAVTRKYEAGEPFPYPSHQEVSIQRKEWA
ncbi:ABC transporter ATP-binding protein [Brevibacillus borstelensis]|uniref:ABC transporter ATP-binding protein n=1 Tax=Brevibacillus borstelensis TaxID=45462 RepID=UPI0030BCCE13